MNLLSISKQIISNMSDELRLKAQVELAGSFKMNGVVYNLPPVVREPLILANGGRLETPYDSTVTVFMKNEAPIVAWAAAERYRTVCLLNDGSDILFSTASNLRITTENRELVSIYRNVSVFYDRSQRSYLPPRQVDVLWVYELQRKSFPDLIRQLSTYDAVVNCLAGENYFNERLRYNRGMLPLVAYGGNMENEVTVLRPE